MKKSSEAMVEESIFKQELIGILNQQSDGWIDGDKEPDNHKKADIVNRNLLIAIEIKDDNHYKIIPDGVARTTDLKLMNQRYSDHVNSANKKFKHYPDFKTVLLFRTEYIPQTVKYAIEGLDQYKFVGVGESLSYIGKVGKYTKYGKDEVGGYLIFTHRMYYFPNYLAKPERVLSKESIGKLLGREIEDIE